ncbi:hypothetical protein CC1G_01875 [Coprinopsis cinerea okayama7|uniref:F-box domain-containing protein n=1 Tax=Coprinopsis cinerea (strain Okayama-7 / 130 / ATCC MYA-4618 / FGSC 9003) TaxID=240176 RepID=A8N2R1_COPC7|nr:hypothetical protein CC1G_01875 [Coprinopsis cinerea okayama7\|eukprot:XP_001829195.1 hypothetical protein CC1G_01875 [Coprinopsis cinerea okayama7\
MHFTDLPPEVLLYILTFLDLPDLEALARAFPALVDLTTDPILHKYRLTVVAPSRISHQLFGKSPQGYFLRPTIGDLVHRGVIRGLGIERRWRTGNYFYSVNSIKQYESSQALFRRHVSHVLTVQLRRRVVESRTTSLRHLLSSHVFPDLEASSVRIDRSLMPIVRQLKWSFQRDKLAQSLKKSIYGKGGLSSWLEGPGRSVLKDENEKVRLAICPDIRRRIGFFEQSRQL